MSELNAGGTVAEKPKRTRKPSIPTVMFIGLMLQKASEGGGVLDGVGQNHDDKERFPDFEPKLTKAEVCKVLEEKTGIEIDKATFDGKLNMLRNWTDSLPKALINHANRSELQARFRALEFVDERGGAMRVNEADVEGLADFV